MDYQNAAQTAPSMTRSELLESYFKVFMEADYALNQARNNKQEASYTFETAKDRLAIAEKQWSEASQQLAQLLIQASPEPEKKQVEYKDPYADAPMPSERGIMAACQSGRPRW